MIVIFICNTCSKTATSTINRTDCHAGQHWYNRMQRKYITKHNTRFSTGIISCYIEVLSLPQCRNLIIEYKPKQQIHTHTKHRLTHKDKCLQIIPSLPNTSGGTGSRTWDLLLTAEWLNHLATRSPPPSNNCQKYSHSGNNLCASLATYQICLILLLVLHVSVMYLFVFGE